MKPEKLPAVIARARLEPFRRRWTRLRFPGLPGFAFCRLFCGGLRGGFDPFLPLLSTRGQVCLSARLIRLRINDFRRFGAVSPVTNHCRAGLAVGPSSSPSNSGAVRPRASAPALALPRRVLAPGLRAGLRRRWPRPSAAYVLRRQSISRLRRDIRTRAATVLRTCRGALVRRRTARASVQALRRLRRGQRRCAYEPGLA